MGQIANQKALELAHKANEGIKKSKHGNLILMLVLLVISIAFTIIVCTVDRQAIGPDGTVVGLATINGSFAEAAGLNLTWDKISDVAMIIAILTAVSFMIVGFIQLVKRKSLKKVDSVIWILAAMYVIVVALYVLFDKVVVINLRPVLLPDELELESSFPSTHVLVICTIMATASSAWNKLCGEKHATLVNILRLISILTMAIAVAGRLISGVHWFTDIAGAALYSCFLISVYEFLLGKSK